LIITIEITMDGKNIHRNSPCEGNWYFQRAFADGGYVASGRLVLLPGGCKPAKIARDSTYVGIHGTLTMCSDIFKIFNVTHGKITATVHKTAYALCAGAIFMVPRGM
jgi:hypothetical protein